MLDLVGTWRLIATRAWDETGNPVSGPYQPHPAGLVTFDGTRMMAVLMDASPDLPDGAPRVYNSYCGTYRFDGAVLTTRVDGAVDTHWIGGDQVRQVRVEGTHVILTPPPRRVGGVMQTRELTWERIAGERIAG
jgi:hypothetical protein